MDKMAMTSTAALRPKSEPQFVMSGAGRQTGEAGMAWTSIAHPSNRACLLTQHKTTRATANVAFNVPQRGTPPRGAPS